MNANTMAVLQSLLAMGHIANVGLYTVTKNPLASYLLAIVMGGISTYLQIRGNASQPPVQPPPPGTQIKVVTTPEGKVSETDPKPTPPMKAA